MTKPTEQKKASISAQVASANPPDVRRIQVGPAIPIPLTSKQQQTPEGDRLHGKRNNPAA
jgi:hypothetical protein